ncbi:twin-arginine translocase subunit TatB [Polymorphobacter arshaanensis]|uniref:Sec-independent protein translocase protein TatB n=1 Tax=Glacieibacterium arshaanense TaxID=2511025 RepID=A0A4Y9EP98_9SPHN|nr:twin-arginine translocase subunit TatB [Polymorphobacter arshaanensis]
MFDIGYSELLLIAVVALVVIGPKDLPRVMRMVGGWVGKGRAMTRHVRAGFDTMMREAELEEMQKAWAKQNEEIMRATPSLATSDWMGVTDTPAPESHTAIAATAETTVAESFSVTDESARAAVATEAAVDVTAKPAAKPRAKAKPKTQTETAAKKPAPKRRAKAADA